MTNTKIKYINCSEFDKELKQLSKKYKSIYDDFFAFKLFLKTIIESWQDIESYNIVQINWLWKDFLLPVYKVRNFTCQSLRSDKKLRLIFTYDKTSWEIQFIEFLEIYAKADKEVENRDRIRKYLAWKDHIE